MKTGTVKFFNEAKGFGFIKDEAGEEFFVHATGLIDKIREDDWVTRFDWLSAALTLGVPGRFAAVRRRLRGGLKAKPKLGWITQLTPSRPGPVAH